MNRTRYRTIVADPPWPLGDSGSFSGWNTDGSRHPACPYPTMTLDEIKALPVKSLANNRDGDAHLYLWTTAGFLRATYEVAEAWGFEPLYPLVWCKPPRGKGLGGTFASNVEFVLFCRRAGYMSVDTRDARHDIAAITTRIGEITREAGLSNRDLNELVGLADIAEWWTSPLPKRCAIPKPDHWQTLCDRVPALKELDDAVRKQNDRKGQDRKAPEHGPKLDTRWWQWPRSRHSEKPEAFLDIVEQVSPGPYAELFARRARFGWDYPIGDQSLGGIAA